MDCWINILLGEEEAEAKKGIQGKDGGGVEVKGGEHLRSAMRKSPEIDNHKRYEE